MSTCPMCKKPSAEAYKPFCSKRCAEVDLGRWLTESYTLPAKETAEEDGE